MELKLGYKQTEVGIIPEDWEVRKLGHIAILERGKFSARPRNDPKYFGGNTPFIQTGDITNSNGSLITYSQTLNKDGLQVSKLFPKNTLFFTIAANIGDVGIPVFETACPDSLIAILPKSGFEKKWLFHILRSKKSDFEKLATSNAQLNINLEKLNPYLLSIPPLSEQKAIASVLSDIDALLSSLNKLIAKKQNIKQAAMQQLLTGKKRLSKFGDQWQEKKLSDVIEKIVGGGTPSRSTPNYWGVGIPWATVKDFATFNPWSTQESITKEGLANSSSNLIPKGTLIISTRMVLGKAALYEVDIAINQDLKALFIKQTISGKYLFFLLEYLRTYIEELGNGSTVKGLALSDLKNIKFSLPPLHEQKAIAEVLSDMDAEIIALEQKRTKIQALKQGMMQELLTGRIRLPITQVENEHSLNGNKTTAKEKNANE